MINTKIITRLLGLFVLFYFYACQRNTPQTFPKNWEGKYKGNLEISTPKGIVQTVPMELHILPIDSVRWTWKIIYSGQARNYELFLKDALKGHYVLDEKNDILLNSFLIGNTLYDEFQVQGVRLMSHTRKEKNKIYYEIIVKDTTIFQRTGGTNDSIPPVFDYRIKAVQKAILKKING